MRRMRALSPSSTISVPGAAPGEGSRERWCRRARFTLAEAARACFFALMLSADNGFETALASVAESLQIELGDGLFALCDDGEARSPGTTHDPHGHTMGLGPALDFLYVIVASGAEDPAWRLAKQRFAERLALGQADCGSDHRVRIIR